MIILPLMKEGPPNFLYFDEKYSVVTIYSLFERHSHMYLIFVISFTQAGFSKNKFYTHTKTTKDTKNTKNVSEKVKCMQFFTQSGKIYT